MGILKTKGNTTGVPIQINLDESFVLQDMIGEERDISNLFDGVAIHGKIDFTGLDVDTMEECFRGTYFSEVDFTTLEAKSIPNLKHMVTDANVSNAKTLHGTIYGITCKDDFILYYNDFYGNYTEFVEYLDFMSKDTHIDASLYAAADKLNRVRK